jgi:hypothetical protein
MIPANLWAEIIIAGFFYLLAGCFIILNGTHIYDLQFIPNFKDYIGIISILAVFLSYVLGMLMHRVIQVLIFKPLKFLIRKLKVDFRISPDANLDYYLNCFALYQYGSPYLHREIDIQFSAFALFTSLIISLPLLGASLYRWLLNTVYSAWALSELVTFAVFSLLFLIVDFHQWRKYIDLLNVSFVELMKIHQRTISEDNQSFKQKPRSK